MKTFSLRTVIDDLLLLVRNNNISESEDLSRAQLAAWILSYRNTLIRKEKQKKQNDDGADAYLEELAEDIGPLELEEVESKDDTPLFTRQTKEELPNLFDNDPDNIISVTDQTGCVIQMMHGQRRHYHYFRKYTFNELTWDYDGKRILIQGDQDFGELKYINVRAILDDADYDGNEEDIKIPAWMIPDIKTNILKNELSFMIKMPSDDDNNSTLDGIKPHGPQDQEK